MKPLLNLCLPGLILACLLLAGSGNSPASASGKPVLRYTAVPKEGEPTDKEKPKTARSFSSRNNSTIKIYPDVIKRDMHVVAKDNDGQLIDFFVFDLQGTLIQHYKMKPKDHNRIAGLARGKYIYRVFRGDTENAAGQFEIR